MSPIMNIDAYMSGMLGIDANTKSQTDLLKQENVKFEEVFNMLMSKELLKPILSSSLFAGSQEYAQVMGDALLKFISENQTMFDFVGGEVPYGK